MADAKFGIQVMAETVVACPEPEHCHVIALVIQLVKNIVMGGDVEFVLVDGGVDDIEGFRPGPICTTRSYAITSIVVSDFESKRSNFVCMGQKSGSFSK